MHGFVQHKINLLDSTNCRMLESSTAHTESQSEYGLLRKLKKININNTSVQAYHKIMV